MQKIKVSVLIYVLNDFTHIEKCIRSVMNQTLREIEIIVIDGGSTDGTLQIIEKLANVDTRIRVLHSLPGVGRQFNIGLRAAKGEYVGICESDDYVLPDMYKEKYWLCSQNCLDVLMADFNRFCEFKGKEIMVPFTVLKDRSLYDQVLFPREDTRPIKMGVNGYWSGLYRREFLMEENIFMNETKGAAYQDTSIAFFALVKARRMMVSRDAGYCYRWDNLNSSVNSPRKITALTEEYALLKERLMKEKLFDRCKEFYFLWKVNGLAWFYGRIQKEFREEYTENIGRELEKDWVSGEYKGSELTDQEKIIIDKVMKNELLNHFCLRDTALNGMKRRLKEIEKNRKIVIFGSGNLGMLVQLYMEYVGKRDIVYIDNKKELWEQYKNDIPILQPEKASKLFWDAVYIIANTVHYEDMEKQLMRCGIDSGSIIVCSDYGFFLNHVLFDALKETERW